jgi:hypothetical protein
MKKRSYRKRKLSEDVDREDESEDVRKVLEETRELQKFRDRPKGVR